MKKKCYILVLALLSLSIIVSGIQEKEFEYEFIQEDSYYSFRGSFLVKTEPDSLINLIYNFNNLLDYTFGAQSLELIQQGENWYDVSYTYRKFLVLKNTSTWRRTIKPDEHKIVFEMLSSKSNLKIMPEVLFSNGFYQITQEEDGCRVEYFQECQLKSGIFKKAYISMAKKEAVKFLFDFKLYLEKNCE